MYRLIWKTIDGDELSMVVPYERLEHLIDVCIHKGLEVVDWYQES